MVSSVLAGVVAVTVLLSLASDHRSCVPAEDPRGPGLKVLPISGLTGVLPWALRYIYDARLDFRGVQGLVGTEVASLSDEVRSQGDQRYRCGRDDHLVQPQRVWMTSRSRRR